MISGFVASMDVKVFVRVTEGLSVKEKGSKSFRKNNKVTE
jgi:hypothetical protein